MARFSIHDGCRCVLTRKLGTWPGVGPVRYKTHSVQRADDFGTGPLRYIDKHMPRTCPLRYIFQYDFGTYDLDLQPPDGFHRLCFRLN